MSNHDMSDTACRERVEQQQRLDKLDNAVQVLADTCEDLMSRQQQMAEIMEMLHELSKLNRASINTIQEEVKLICSKLA